MEGMAPGGGSSPNSLCIRAFKSTPRTAGGTTLNMRNSVRQRVTPTCVTTGIQVQRCELFSEVRVAPQIRETPLSRGFGNMANLVHPLRHILLRRRLEQVVTTVFGVQLERKRSFVVDELSDATVCEAQNESGLAGGEEIQFLSSTFLSRGNGGLRCESTGYRSHELEEGGRHALLVPMSFGNTRLRLAAVHRLVKVIFPLLVSVLLLPLLPAQPVASVLVSFVLLLLSKNQEVKRSRDPLVRMNAITSGFTDSILADEAVVELNIDRFLFDLPKSGEVVEANLVSPPAGDRTEGSGIRSQMTQESSNRVSLT